MKYITIKQWLKKYKYTAYQLAQDYKIFESRISARRKHWLMLDQEKPVMVKIVTDTLKKRPK